MRFLYLFLLLLFASPIFALDCDQATTTLEINRCTKAEQDRVEDELNSVYKQVIDSLSNTIEADVRRLEVKDRLISAQRAWIRFRIKDCQAAYARYQGASIRNIQYISCMQQRAEQRIKELKSFIQNEN